VHTTCLTHSHALIQDCPAWLRLTRSVFHTTALLTQAVLSLTHTHTLSHTNAHAHTHTHTHTYLYFQTLIYTQTLVCTVHSYRHSNGRNAQNTLYCTLISP